MRLIRALLFTGLLFATAIMSSLWGHVLYRAAPTRLLPLGQAWARFLLAALRIVCGITLDVQGLEHIPGTGAALIAAQHQSAFDTMIWLALLPNPSYVLKQELTRLPFFGPLFVGSGHIPLDRQGGGRALRALVAAVQQAVQRGKQIVIFPEGTRVPPGTRAELQVGIAALARATGLPVIPAATDSGLFWPRDWLKLRPGVIHIRIHPPIPPGTDRSSLITALEGVFYGGETGSIRTQEAPPGRPSTRTA